MIYPVTGKTITQYKMLANDPVTSATWKTEFRKEFGCMIQGDDKTGTKGTNCIFVMTHDKIAQIPEDRVVTYVRIVVDF